jgi:hypothetical protein
LDRLGRREKDETRKTHYLVRIDHRIDI